jgi:hypothetical protein
MPDNPKSGRKDRRLVRETTSEIHEEVNQERLAPKYENPNRDRARGDWDRSRKHTDEFGKVGP